MVSSSAKAALLARNRANAMATPAIASNLVVDIEFSMTCSFGTLLEVIRLL
jgi:hypothetical protein